MRLYSVMWRPSSTSQLCLPIHMEHWTQKNWLQLYFTVRIDKEQKNKWADAALVLFTSKLLFLLLLLFHLKDIALLIITELTFICSIHTNAYDKPIPVQTNQTYFISQLKWMERILFGIQSQTQPQPYIKLKWDRQRLRLNGTAQTNEIRPSPRIHFVTHTRTHVHIEGRRKTHTFVTCPTIDSLLMRFTTEKCSHRCDSQLHIRTSFFCCCCLLYGAVIWIITNVLRHTYTHYTHHTSFHRYI